MAASPNLFVAGLHPHVDDKTLEAVFIEFGEIVSAKVMVDLHTAKSRGFGFVLFASVECAARARSALQGMPLGAPNACISIEFSTQHSVDHLGCKSDAVYVRNIPRQTTAADVRQHFSTRFGGVKRVELLPDTAPGATGSFIVALIHFESAREAVQAERATQCAPNVFATGAMTNVPPLLAKLAEKPSERARRLRTERHRRQKDPRQAMATANHPPVKPTHTQPGTLQPAILIPACVLPAAPPFFRGGLDCDTSDSSNSSFGDRSCESAAPWGAPAGIHGPTGPMILVPLMT